MSPSTLKQYRDKAAERQKRWREAQKAKGLNRVSIWLDQDAERILHNATIDQGEGKQQLMTEFITRLLQESQNVTHNDTRLQELEAELFQQRERAKLAENRLLEQVAETERHWHQALGLAEVNGRLQSEITELQRRIQELEQATQGKNAGKAGKRPGSKQGTLQPETLTRAKQLKAQGMTYNEIADELNKQGIPTLSGKGRWTAESVRKFLNRHG